MASPKQEPGGGEPTGGGGNSAGSPQTQHLQGDAGGAGNERGEQGGGLGGHGIPESLRPGIETEEQGGDVREQEIPESLRPGPRGGADSTNPFVRAQHTGNPPASGPPPVANPWAGEEEKGAPDASLLDANVPGPRLSEVNAPNAGAPSAPSQHQGEVFWGLARV